MIRACVVTAIVLSLPLFAQAEKKPASGDKTAKKASGQSKPSKPAKLTSMTGCIDQRGENFLLVEDQELKPIAALDGNDPEKRSFAKYLGRKVTVTGVLSSGGDPPAMQVRQIKQISEICTGPEAAPPDAPR